MSIKYSILIAHYNSVSTLSYCLNSALNQEFDRKDYEIVVYDDASSEDISIIDELKNPRIKLYSGDVNNGVGFAKRYLVEVSIGKYFLFLDADDYLDLNALSIFDQIIDNSDCSFYYADSRLLSNDGNVVLRAKGRSFEYTGSMLSYFYKYPIFHPVLFSRNHYYLTNGIDTRMKVAEDIDLFLKMEEVGKGLFVDKVLYNYRKSDISLSQVKKLDKKIRCILFQFISGISASERRSIDFERLVDETANEIIRLQKKDLIKGSLLFRIKFIIKQILDLIFRL